MEESRAEEPFLKIEKTWSESQGNFENITVKEENISDVEPETLENEIEQNENYDCLNESFVNRDNIKVDKGYCDDDDVSSRVDGGIKNNDGDDNNDDNGKISCVTDGNSKGGIEDDEKREKLDNGKCGKKCTHDSKYLKVVKKKLRCTICKSILCPECYCTVNAPLQNHFSKSDNNNRSVYHCKLCSMIFKSNCALQAHIRVHLLDTPYVCPDCGAMYNNIYFLSLHLINKCHHVYKVIKNWCKFCLSENMAPEEYSAHIEKIHIKPVYKCSLCGLMCETTTDINKHLGSTHKNEKVMAQNYFCCLICGNLIIPKNLYAKHIKYHLDNSATFQNGYLCSCGQSFDTATNFRGHFKGCRKKGILPPQWTYLQVSLKTQEMLQVQSASHKSNYLVSSQLPLMSGSDDRSRELGLDKRKMDYNLFEDEDSSEEPDETSESTSRRNSTDSESSKSKRNKGSRKKETNSVDISNRGNKIGANNSNKDDRNKVLEEIVEVNSSKIMDEAHSKLIESVEKNNSKPVNEDSTQLVARDGKGERICDKTVFIPNVQLVEELSRECGNESVCLKETERVKETTEKADRIGDKSMKIVYDHIPCDHLGYLKTQQSSDLLLDKNLKRTRSNCIRNCEFMEGNIAVLDSDNYLITSVLDEKTGFMRTKRVYVQKTPVEVIEDDENVAKDSDEIYVVSENLENSDSSAALPWRDPQKTKSTTVFSCPFCSVLFPRHFSSFQRFRLHLECYHPDASIDITVDRTEIPKSKTSFTSITVNENSDSDDEAYDLDDIDFQTRLNNTLKEGNAGEDRQHEKIDQKKRGLSGQMDRRDSEHDSPHNKSDESKSTNDGRSGSLSRRFSDESRTESLPGEETEFPKRRRTAGGNDVVENSESADSETSNAFSKKINSELVVTVKPDGAEGDAIVSDITNKESNPATNAKNRSCSEQSLADCGSGEAELEKEVIVSCYDENAQMNVTPKEETATSGSCFTAISERDLHLKNSSSKLGDDCQDVDLDKTESNQSVKDVTPDRSCERLNPRRESDVWSEFYKTLKIAETFKKTNVNNKDKSREGSEETSILKNYTNKRVVKKPKRYRESSDSDESNEDVKQFDTRIDADDDDLYIKKKKLLNRLENVDYRVLEYVFKMLERKQKSIGLLKKSATDGRTGRRRLSNGMKASGKQQQQPQHKTAISENDEDTMDYSVSVGDKDSFDDNLDDADWDAATGTSFDEKVTDRRRGRPKKSDMVSMRERRRSDFDRELSLIEKSLDADDTDFFMSKRKRRFSSKPQYYKKQSMPVEKNDFSSGQVITTKSCEAEKKLTCAVCKESYQSEPEFREHIQTHRMDESSHQCMECGECFVVRPSLEKHLHAFHKIRDVQKYIEENECSVVEKVEEPEMEPLKENQCKVCMDQFESAHDLNKHFRIHGMAFLREVKKDYKST